MRKRLIEFLVLLMVALGAGPVGAAIWQWSTTAGSNATADPSINWAESMAPSSVNDSARAMMAALAAWRNDISVVNTTAGTATAYTLTTSEGVNTTPANGQMLAAIFHLTNGVAPTLVADGGTAYPIWLNGAPVPAATLIAGSPYRFSFNAGSSAWVLENGFANPFSTALGAFMLSTVATPPNSNFIVPIGQCISTTTYATYWAAIGSPASGACPGGQFAVVDVRGRNLTPLDTLSASAANRLTAGLGCGTSFTTMGASCVNGTQTKLLDATQIPSNLPYTDSGHTHNQDAATVKTGSGVSLIGSGGTGTQSGGTTQLGFTGIVINPSGGQPHSTVDPNIGVFVFLRVL